MSKLIYEVTVSSDGKRSVSIKSDDPLALKDALPLAKKIQEQLSEAPDSRGEVSSTPQQTPLPSVDVQPEAPRCQIHATPMTQVQGKHGPFWSCHQRNPDGSWCSYRPNRAASSSSAYGTPPA